jgi:cold shock CspA family protein
VGQRVLLVRVWCGDDDVFVHVSNVDTGGATLADGQTVEFEGRPWPQARGNQERLLRVSRLTPRDRRVVSAAPVGSRATGLEWHSRFEPRAR